MNSVRAFFFFFGWSRALESFLLRPEACRTADEGARNSGIVERAAGQLTDVRRRVAEALGAIGGLVPDVMGQILERRKIPKKLNAKPAALALHSRQTV